MRKQLLPPEKVYPMKMYTLSINTKELRNHTFNHDYRQYIGILQKYIEPFVHQFVQQFEISKTGKLHTHGTITFNTDQNIFLFYRNIREADIAIEIDTIDDVDKWMCYCLKSGKFHKVIEDLYKLSPIVVYNRPKVRYQHKHT